MPDSIPGPAAPVYPADLKPPPVPADEIPMATTGIPPSSHALDATAALADALQSNLSDALRGKPQVVRMTVAAVLAGGHVLIEDVPGVGKTLLAKALARSVHGAFRRIQGTPDLLPADLTGVAMLDQRDGTWRFRPGPLFANVVLVDEINRATPRTQSALLEAMEERQVSADGSTMRLPDPFVVIATQNPFEHAGTFPLVEGQRDRFALALSMGIPSREAEREILSGTGGVDTLASLQPVTDADHLRAAIAATRTVHVAEQLVEYLLDVVDATRTHDGVTLGASPRASVGLRRLAQAHAVVSGRRYVTPDDIKAVVPDGLAHRLILSGGPSLERGRAVVEGILRRLPPPRG